jgi:hypothetical protein
MRLGVRERRRAATVQAFLLREKVGGMERHTRGRDVCTAVAAMATGALLVVVARVAVVVMRRTSDFTVFIVVDYDMWCGRIGDTSLALVRMAIAGGAVVSHDDGRVAHLAARIGVRAHGEE